ncbi:MAG: YihY/virulence factor BrkB family protein [Nocardioidaceae bacterium]|nr:YihY/virulence factor BrkB family protein [Nocardioidaceae bacterium]MCL2612461.1 YihY/virulence factor BrkB family protein [Nocardioidaceae bacterium]
MAGIKERLDDARQRSPLLDHAIRTVQHYGSVGGNQQAAGVTYFGFLSVFPVLAIAFFVIGYVARVDSEARDALTTAVGQVLPGLIGDSPHQLSLHDIESSAGAAGLIGLVGVLYAGLGWLSALRTALITVFEEPTGQQPSFAIGKLRDLSALVVLGLVLLAGVAVSGGISQLSGRILAHLGWSSGLGWLVTVLAILIGIGASVIMFYLMFVMLARPTLPRRPLWQAALLAGVGFEALKQLSGVLLAGSRGQPAFQAFGIALILVVWINYFSRLTLYAAAWAQTSPAARAAREARAGRAIRAAARGARRSQANDTGEIEDVSRDSEQRHGGWAAPFLSGAGAMLAVLAVLKRKRQ